MDGAGHEFGDPRRRVDLVGPFRHRPEDGAIVEFLERLPAAGAPLDLADEHEHRRRALLRDMDAVHGIGRARPARDETDAGPPRRLAHGLGHDRRPGFLPAHGDLDRPIMKRIEDREIALPGHAEHVLDALNDQLIDQNLCRRAAGDRRVHGGLSDFRLA